MKTSFYIKFVGEKPYHLDDYDLMVMLDDVTTRTTAIETVKEKMKNLLKVKDVDFLFIDCIDDRTNHDTQITIYDNTDIRFDYYAFTSFVDTI